MVTRCDWAPLLIDDAQAVRFAVVNDTNAHTLHSWELAQQAFLRDHAPCVTDAQHIQQACAKEFCVLRCDSESM